MNSNIPLAPLTTLGVGGNARFYTEAHSEKDVVDAVVYARERSLPLFVLGGGSNIVIADGGFEGLVLRMCVSGIEAQLKGHRALVRVGAGVMWDEFVIWSIGQGFAGLECLSGVPGTVGGAVVANLGAYGAQVSDTFVQADVLDTQSGSTAVRVFKKEECDFSYHDSVFGREQRRYIVVGATFELSKDPSVQPSYRDNRFDMQSLRAALGHAPTLGEVREEVLRIREEKGSLIMNDRLSYKSAGSFFHMPFVSGEQYARVTERARSLDAAKEMRLRPWAWKQQDGRYKIAPGFLLEYTQFQKGYVKGGAGISPRHTLSIINVADARAQDIAELARAMQDAVEKIFDIRLVREVEYIGDVEAVG